LETDPELGTREEPVLKQPFRHLGGGIRRGLTSRGVYRNQVMEVWNEREKSWEGHC